MIKMIRMNLRRLRKMRSLWIILLLIAGMTFFITYMMYSLTEGDYTYGILQLMPISRAFYTIMVSIFTVIYCCADMKSGYVKNIGGQIKSRSRIIISKSATLFIFMVVSYADMLLVQALGQKILFGTMDLGGKTAFYAYAGAQFLLHFAACLFCMFITELVRKQAAAMTIVVVLSMGISELVYDGINAIIDNPSFDITDYMLFGQINFLDITYNAADTRQAILVAVYFAVASVILACISITKRDVV